MDAVVLAAGEGTRLQPLTDRVPKPLVPVAGKPLITYAFDRLVESGLSRAIVVVGYRGEQVEAEFGDSYRDLSLTYVRQPERKGLAHALSMAADRTESDVVVVNGDNVYAGNEAEAVEAHRNGPADITLLTETVSKAKARSGAVVVADEDGSVTGLVEKPDDPPSTTGPIPWYVLPDAIFPACEIIQPSDRGEYELPDAIDLLCYSSYSVQTIPYEGWRVNVNTPADIERAEAKLAGDE